MSRFCKYVKYKAGGKMPNRIHKPEYHTLKMPFLFDMVCLDRKAYTISMTFQYQYLARQKGALRPSVFANKPEVCRLHYFLTRAFLSFLEEYRHLDFPIEWQEYFSPKVKMPKVRPYPYASDDKIKEYISNSICDSLKGKIIRQADIQKERLDYLFQDLKITSWNFLIHSCTPHRQRLKKQTNKVLRLYTDLRVYLRE